nr:unnamed protein product [Callosobruchus analis]
MPEIENCNICRKKVQDNQDGLLCEKCLIWKHRVCIDMSTRAYEQISKSTQPWFCDPCKKADGDKQKQSTSGSVVTLEDVMDKLIKMETKYDVLMKKYNEQVAINEKLQVDIVKIKSQLNKQEQLNLRNNVIIQGIPQKSNENVTDIVKTISEKLEVQNVSNFIAYRLGNGSGDGSRPIKIEFSDENSKLKFMKSKKRLKLTSKDLGFNENKKVYLNHDLTATNLELLKAARICKQKMDFKFLWINNGNILMRKDENSKVIFVDDLEQLKN